jgi:hypothetical protein
MAGGFRWPCVRPPPRIFTLCRRLVVVGHIGLEMMAGTVFGAATVIGASIELQAPCRWRLQQVSERQADKHVSGWGPGVASVTRHSPVRETESSVQRSVRRYDSAATDLAWRIFAMWQARWAVELLGTGEGTGSGDDVLGVVKHGVKADSIGLEPARPRRDFETVWRSSRRAFREDGQLAG